MARTVTCIPATKQRFHNDPEQFRICKRRVAAYARVSTDSDEQFTSFEAQKKYYSDYIKANPEWEMVDVYADEGISGVSTKSRDGFNTMIEDALNGRIDLIITKSLSRFARNTVDSLVTVRKLREKSIEVYFEKENLYTLDPKNEFLLTIFSSLAQEESRSISENVTWGQRQRIAEGRYSLPYKHFLGYKKGEDGFPEIVEEEAKTVRLIYRMFLEGKTVGVIARFLTDCGIPTPTGKQNWHISTVESILSNEKYKGDAQLQKTFTVDFLTKKQKQNEGEVPMYYIEEAHPAIIDPEIFERVQNEFRRRKALGGKYSCASCFSSKLICGDCGAFYGSKVWHSTSEYRKTIWQCNDKFKGSSRCTTPNLNEADIKNAFVAAFNRLFKMRKDILDGCEFIESMLTDCTELEREDADALAELEITKELAEKLINENASSVINQDDYKSKYEALSSRHDKASAEHERIMLAVQERKAKAQSVHSFMASLRERKAIMETFDEKTWLNIVDNVIVKENGNLIFYFFNGTDMEVTAEVYLKCR